MRALEGKYDTMVCICKESLAGDELEAWFENYIRDLNAPDRAKQYALRYPVNYCTQMLNSAFDIYITGVPTDMWSAVMAEKVERHRKHKDEAKTWENSQNCRKCGREVQEPRQECPQSKDEENPWARVCKKREYEIEQTLISACHECDNHGYMTTWKAYVQCDIVEHGFLEIFRHVYETSDPIE